MTDQPAHFQLIERIFKQEQAWSRVESRLARYPAVAGHFPLESLRHGHNRPPFGVHYLAWRLGVWNTEQLFETFERLLAHAATLPGWEGEASLLTSADFGQFWSLLWQMQVARRLSKNCTNVRWLGGDGPDLAADFNNAPIFVECYSYRKKADVTEFLQEILRHVHPAIRVEHNLCMPIVLPGAPSVFLDQTLRPFLNDRVLSEAKRAAMERWPIDLPLPEGTTNLRVSLHSDDMQKHRPSLDWNTSGPPERYLEVALREATEHKAGQNQLARHANNVVTINILSEDFQSSLDRQNQLGEAIPEPVLPPDIHLATVSTCGIDRESATFRLGFSQNPHHPALRAFGLVEGPLPR